MGVILTTILNTVTNDMIGSGTVLLLRQIEARLAQHVLFLKDKKERYNEFSRTKST